MWKQVSLFWINAWHITNLKLVITLTMFLLMWWIFLFIDFKYFNCSLVVCSMTLPWCFLVRSITSIRLLMFMSEASLTREKTLDLLCFIVVFLRTIGVASGFVGATSGVFWISTQFFKKPWVDSVKSSMFTKIIWILNAPIVVYCPPFTFFLTM